MSELFEQLDFVENPQYEQIISDLQQQQFSIVETFFNDEEVAALRDALLEKQADDAFKKAAIGNKVNENVVKTIRGDHIFWIDETKVNAAEGLFFNKINSLITYLNQTCFMGILYKEFHYAIYPQGTFYKRHIDTFQNDDRRKLSVVCYLNHESWQPENGGELVLYLNRNGIEVPKAIYPFPGRVVIFESQILEHEVKPVNTKRLSITGWLKTR
ncbi:oxidoreductase [Mangrovimonas yunxiaonensis]|uniref:Oxidoreductase n=1 Tax=Mangrovimonas yunxiaonensis TaxID=1197477 RepID=A0A084TKU3_9FLAO|nr:2OG-Fe(II) oxygenase [Mangrovimonas yunxiaonensis]KFB01329.1 oxidoreductase [Mangrovimonas yunxiaonensis]GGH37339.1 oxidoreductase [Mangrovimonas yunxiaonensis]